MASNDLLASLEHLSDADLLVETKRLTARERHATVHVIAALMEVENRRLYLGEGYSSLFTYCTHVLHLSEHAAYSRIEAARTARRVPTILNLLADGALTLTTVGLLAPHLTPVNQAALIEATRHKSKRDVERVLAALRPLPAVPSSVRKLPAPPPVASVAIVAPLPSGTFRRPEAENLAADLSSLTTGASHHAPKPAVLVPLAPERYKMQITISREGHDRLRRAQELLRHVIPSGDPAAIVERALAVLVDDLERKKLAAVKSPRPATTASSGSRHVPAAVKREVWTRDGGQCAFVGTEGRCPERGFLELHHVIPFADGGASDAQNLQLRCRAHNAFEAEAWFGPLRMSESAEEAPTRSGPG